MIKINYPENIIKFNTEYVECLGIEKKQWSEFKRSIEDENIKKIFEKYPNLHDILLLPFEELLSIYQEFPKQEIEQDDNGKKKKSIYEEFFSYDKLQPKISKFFMMYDKELNLKTCYFCNIDFINVISISILDILTIGDEKDLKALNEIGVSLAKRIIEYRKTNEINQVEDLENINGINSSTIEKIKKSKIKKNVSTKLNTPNKEKEILEKKSSKSPKIHHPNH